MISYITIGLIALNFTLTIVSAIMYSSKNRQFNNCKLNKIIKVLALLNDNKINEINDSKLMEGKSVKLESLTQMCDSRHCDSCKPKRKVKDKEDLMLEDLLAELLKSKEAIKQINSAIASEENENKSLD